MKISNILKNKKTFSMEFFPPKTEEGYCNLLESLKKLEGLNLDFISITYGAGGSTREKTIDLLDYTKNTLKVESMAHLTCVGHSQDEIKEILNKLKSKNIENIIALRGDPKKGDTNFIPHEYGFEHAINLVNLIKKNDDFCVATAAYPEGHVESKDKYDVSTTFKIYIDVWDKNT